MAKHALITGASSGIGAALAVEMAGRGFDVGLVARRADRLEQVAGQVLAAGRMASTAVADVADHNALAQAFAALESALGPVEIAVANAGVAGSPDSTQLDTELVRRVTDVNFQGAVNTAALAIPGMVARGRGRLAVVSSMAGYRGLPRSGAYCASKAAISVFWESLRVDLRRHGIVCTTIEPGFVVSEMTAGRKQSMPFLLSAEEAARRMADGILAGKRRVVFPRRMGLLMGLVRHSPDWLYDRFFGRKRKQD